MTSTNGKTPRDNREIRTKLRESFADAVMAGKPKTARRLLESFWLWDG
jgi:hypothetical protein